MPATGLEGLSGLAAIAECLWEIPMQCPLGAFFRVRPDRLCGAIFVAKLDTWNLDKGTLRRGIGVPTSSSVVPLQRLKCIPLAASRGTIALPQASPHCPVFLGLKTCPGVQAENVPSRVVFPRESCGELGLSRRIAARLWRD